MVVLVLLGVSVSAFSLGHMSAKNDLESGPGAGNATKVVIETNPNLIVASAADYTAGTAKNNSQVANSLSAKPNTSTTSQSTTKITSSDPTSSAQNNSSNNNSNLPFVASSRGKKYYPVGCSAVKTLSQTNLVYFKDQAEAEAKGYSLSTSCK